MRRKRFFELSLMWYDPEKREAIERAARSVLPFSDFGEERDDQELELVGFGETVLDDDEDEVGELVERLTAAVWHANARYCRVELRVADEPQGPCFVYRRSRLLFPQLTELYPLSTTK